MKVNSCFGKKTFPELIKFMEFFPFKSDDDVSVILKGHLLIEGLLIQYVKKKMKHPDALRNFKFHNYLCLARAMEKFTHSFLIWDACEKLNSLRNKLAHHLMPKDIASLKKDFINTVKKQSGEFPKELAEDFGELKMSIFTLHSHLTVTLHFRKEYLNHTSLLVPKFDL